MNIFSEMTEANMRNMQFPVEINTAIRGLHVYDIEPSSKDHLFLQLDEQFTKLNKQHSVEVWVERGDKKLLVGHLAAEISRVDYRDYKHIQNGGEVAISIYYLLVLQ